MMLIRSFAAFMIAAACCAPAYAATPPSAEQYYEAALEKMRAQPAAPDATYTVNVTATGAKFVATKTKEGEVALAFLIGPHISAMPNVSAAYRGSDHVTAIDTDKGWGTTHSPFFDPTWTGVYDWMHYGWDGPSKEQLAREQKLAADKSTEPPTIATVKAFGVAFYRVVDAGAARCGNGDDGHAVHLIAFSHPDVHPLTDAVIDVRTQELCHVRFGFRQDGAISGNGSVDMDLGRVGGYTLVTDEQMAFNIHLLGIQLKHIDAKIAYRDVAFPQTLPQADFTP